MKLCRLTAFALVCCAATAAEPVEAANNTEVRVMIDPAGVLGVRREGDGRHATVIFYYKQPIKTDNGASYNRLEVLYSLYCDERIFTSYKRAAYDGAAGERAVMVWTGATKAAYAVSHPHHWMRPS